MKVASLIAYVGAFNVLIHMKDACYALKMESSFGPAKHARDLARTGRTIAQEAIVRHMATEDANEAEQILCAAYLTLCGVIAALKAMDTDGAQKIATILDAVAAA